MSALAPAPAPPATLRMAARLAFWLALGAVAFVTLSPIADRPVTPFGPDVERFAAFAVLSGLLVLAYPAHRLRWFWTLVGLAALLEASQNLVGGRHGRLGDFDVKALGATMGALMALAAERLGKAASGAPRDPA